MSLADDIRADIGQKPQASAQPESASLGAQMRTDIGHRPTSEANAESASSGLSQISPKSFVGFGSDVSNAEAVIHMGTGLIAKPISDIAGLAAVGKELISPSGGDPAGFKRSVQDALTYEPRTQAGKMEAEYNPVALIGKGIGAGSHALGAGIRGDHPGIARQAAGDFAEEAVPQAIGVFGPKVIPKVTSFAGDLAQDAVASDRELAAGSEANAAPHGNPIANLSQYASAGASASGVLARLNVASPELQADAQAAFREAQAKHGADWGKHVNWGAIDRQLNADSLPVPGRLTRGQATQDGALLSEEWNKRSTNGLGPTFAAQNENQVANLKAIREQSSPDVYTNTPAEHADTIINAYKDLHAAEKGVIDEKWNAIRQQSSDAMIFDAGKMLEDAQSALKSKKLTAFDPGGQLAELTNDARRGGLTADGYVAWRQNLGREAMKGGNEGAAASAILDATNKSTMLPEAAKYRDMVNDALSTGRTLHQKLALDPAYKAVVNGDASVKDFVNKFIVNGKPENVAQMSNNLAGNDIARQTMRASVLDSLRNSAALDEQYQGNFAAKSFNKQLSHVTPGARAVFDDGELQTLRSLGDYSTHISHGGRDSFKNFSNTATELNTPTHAMGQKLGGAAATAAEAALAHHTGGISIPIISALKSGAAQRAAIKAALEEQEKAAQYVHDATRPAAGFVK